MGILEEVEQRRQYENRRAVDAWKQQVLNSLGVPWDIYAGPLNYNRSAPDTLRDKIIKEMHEQGIVIEDHKTGGPEGDVIDTTAEEVRGDADPVHALGS